MKHRYILRMVVFYTIFAGLFALFASSFSVSPYRDAYQTITQVYKEPEDSLQAVFIGNSGTEYIWCAPYAWRWYGQTVLTYAEPGVNAAYARNCIEDVLKTQKNALFILSLDSMKGRIGDSQIHAIVDYIPNLRDRLEIAWKYCDMIGESTKDRLQYIFPWLTYHTRPFYMFSKMEQFGIYPEFYGLKGMPLKGAMSAESYNCVTNDISEKYAVDDGYGILEELEEKVFLELLDFCESENVNVLFVSLPRAVGNERLRKVNTLEKMVRERGFDVLSLHDIPADIGLDLTQDYYGGGGHTNVHGGLKFTSYVCDYLKEHYGFTDLRGAAGYESWDEAWEKAEALIQHTTLDLERENKPRDYTLSRPDNLTATKEAQGVSVRWDASEGADGYAVYRKTGDKGAWTCVSASVEALDYTDTDGTADDIYTVVPYSENNGEICYGNFLYNGAACGK